MIIEKRFFTKIFQFESVAEQEKFCHSNLMFTLEDYSSSLCLF